ncbi:MAG: ATP-binding protein [Hyphomicrobiales bacterium]|nr:MAG: ATP-binding protein [Hyphomicrobiales bacterium]
MLSIRDLRTKLLTVPALDVEAGECVAIMGPSGSGKSLILRAIVDLDPNEGDITLNGDSRADCPAPEWRRKVGYLAAESGWWADTVGTHFADKEATLPFLEALGLKEEAFSWELTRLSTGEKQRLALARMLAGRPPVLLLDEPTAALDPENAGKVERLLQSLADEGTAIVIVTHSPDQATRLASQIWRVEGDKLCRQNGDQASAETA